MTIADTYDTGTVSVDSSGNVTGSGVIWSLVKKFDLISIDGGDLRTITEVTDSSHLKIQPWSGTASAKPYVIFYNSLLRLTNGELALRTNELVKTITGDGYFVYVAPADSAPDPAKGKDGQYALKPSTGATWLKASGVWNPSGVYGGLYPANNLSDLTDPDDALDNLGGTTVGKAVFKATDASAARTALELTAPVGEMVNRIINPSGRIAQAGLASTADGAYTGFDQWLALTQSNPVTPSQLADVENGTPYMMRMTQANASAQRMGWLQWIESRDCIDLRGKTVTLSARVRMSASTTLRYAIVEWTGTADTITKDVVLDWTNGTFTAGNFFTSTSTTIAGTGSIALTANTLASIALTATISGSANNLAVFFWTDSTQAQNVTLDLTRAQLEVGAFATAFAPRSYGDELRACQRYYYKPTISAAALYGIGYCYAAAGSLCGLKFPVRMRVKPTLTTAGAFKIFTTTDRTIASMTLNAVSTDEFACLQGDGSGWGETPGTGGLLLDSGSGTSALNFDARL